MYQAGDVNPTSGFAFNVGGSTAGISGPTLTGNYAIAAYSGLQWGPNVNGGVVQTNSFSFDDTRDGNYGSYNNPLPYGGGNFDANAFSDAWGNGGMTGFTWFAADSHMWRGNTFTSSGNCWIFNGQSAINAYMLGNQCEPNNSATPVLIEGGASHLLFVGNEIAFDGGNGAFTINHGSDFVVMTGNILQSSITGAPYVLNGASGAHYTYVGNVDPSTVADVHSGAISNGGSPVLTTGACHGSSATGGLTAGTFTAAVCSSSNYIISGLPAAPNGWNCVAEDRSVATDLLVQSASTTTSATLSGTTASGNVIQFSCQGY